MLKERSPLLKRLDLELTERCNLNCIHCTINLPENDRSARERELATEDVREILREAASLGCLPVRFTGGEPLLREDFEELYLFARRLGLAVHIFTNATRITPKLARTFATVPPLEKIEITLYGMRRESCEAVTGVPGSFDAAWRGMTLLLENEVPFVVKGTYLPPNIHEMHQFEEWASSLPWMTRSPGYVLLLDLRGRRDSERKNTRIRRLRISPEEAIAFHSMKENEYREEMRAFFSKFPSSPGNELFPCNAGDATGCVDAYGFFQLCLLLRHPDTVYDLRKGSLEDALTHFFPEVRTMRAANPDYLSRCARCVLKGLCDQCPAKSWMEHGTLDTPIEYFCDVAHAEARYLKLLGENEMGWEVSDWEDRLRNCIIPDSAR
jgi:radical SAM protein with 4Fe4S-binding SPASM domain